MDPESESESESESISADGFRSGWKVYPWQLSQSEKQDGDKTVPVRMGSDLHKCVRGRSSPGIGERTEGGAWGWLARVGEEHLEAETPTFQQTGCASPDFALPISWSHQCRLLCSAALSTAVRVKKGRKRPFTDCEASTCTHARSRSRTHA